MRASPSTDWNCGSRSAAAPSERRIVQERVRSRTQDLERERRRLRQIAVDDADLAGFHGAQHALEPFDVHRLVQAIVDRLIDQRMIRELTLANDVLGTGDLIRE